MAANPLDGFQINRDEIKYIGEDLQRPECILAEPDGTLWSADARGGVVRISPDGSQKIITQSHQNTFETTTDKAKRFTEGTLPNGLAFAENGDIYISNFGTDCLEIMTREGETKVLIDTIDGEPIGKVNFILRDSKNRIWLTVSTKIKNWMDAISPNIIDGFVALVDEKGIRIVAEGFHFTNEVRLDAKEEWLYIVETCGRRVSRMRVQPDGSLTDREIFGPADTGGFIDGITFDAYGNLWGTHVMIDRIFAYTPEGDFRILLDDSDPKVAAELMKAFDEDRITPEEMVAAGGTIAPWFASVTFGGKDLKTAYIGSLMGTRIPYFQSPVAGLPMIHWK